jgi:hypothetical protein
VFNDPEFGVIATGLVSELGCHSLQKYASTWSSHNGCTMDEIETRRRWKVNTRRTALRYISVKQPHVAAKVELVLCVGGPIG